MVEDINNFIVVSFNHATIPVYSLIHKIGNAIRQPFKIVDYFKDNNGEEWSYGLFLAHLSYFDTYVFLLKNFHYRDTENTLFDNIPNEMEYLINLRPPKMYILMIISNEIKTLQDVEKFIQSHSLSIKLQEHTSKRLKLKLYYSLEKYLQKNDLVAYRRKKTSHNDL